MKNIAFLDIPRKDREKYRKAFEMQCITDALRLLFSRSSQPITLATYAEYRRNREGIAEQPKYSGVGLPTHRTILIFFGSWENAMKEAGLEYSAANELVHTHSIQECVEAYQEVARLTGHRVLHLFDYHNFWFEQMQQSPGLVKHLPSGLTIEAVLGYGKELFKLTEMDEGMGYPPISLQELECHITATQQRLAKSLDAEESRSDIELLTHFQQCLEKAISVDSLFAHVQYATKEIDYLQAALAKGDILESYKEDAVYQLEKHQQERARSLEAISQRSQLQQMLEDLKATDSSASTSSDKAALANS